LENPNWRSEQIDVAATAAAATTKAAAFYVLLSGFPS